MISQPRFQELFSSGQRLTPMKEFSNAHHIRNSKEYKKKKSAAPHVSDRVIS